MTHAWDPATVGLFSCAVGNMRKTFLKTAPDTTSQIFPMSFTMPFYGLTLDCLPSGTQPEVLGWSISALVPMPSLVRNLKGNSMPLHVAHCSSLLDTSCLWPHSVFRPTSHLLMWSSPGNSEKLSMPLENIQVQRRLSTASPEMASQETRPVHLVQCFLQNSHCGSWDVGAGTRTQNSALLLECCWEAGQDLGPQLSEAMVYSSWQSIIQMSTHQRHDSDGG